MDGTVAVRGEHYTDFGNSLAGKLALRYDFNKNFALRGAISTGFRAPTPGQALKRITGTPALLLLLAAIAECTAGERAVLMEEAVHIRLDDRRAVTGTHMRQRLLHGQVNRQRVHAVAKYILAILDFNLPMFRMLKAMICPLPISPNTFSTGTLQSWK